MHYGPVGQRNMELDNMTPSMAGMVLILSAGGAGWHVIGPVEYFATAALALTTHFVLSRSRRNVCLGLLCIRIALLWMDWYIVDFWISTVLLLCRQLLLLSIGLLILKRLLCLSEEKSAAAPSVRGQLLAGSGLLVIAFSGISAYLLVGSVQYIVVTGVSVLVHIGFMMTGIWRRSQLKALSYPVVFLAIGAPTLQLLPDTRDLNFIWVMERRAQSLNVPRWRDTRPSVNMAFECLRHKDSGVRGIAIGKLDSEIFNELVSAHEEFAVGLDRANNEDWWRHSWCKAKWPTPPITHRALPLLIDLLNNGTRRDRMNAAYGIGSTGPKGIPALPGLLKLLHEHGDVENHRVPQDSNSAKSDLLNAQALLMDDLETGFESTRVRQRVAEAIADLGPGAVDAVPQLTSLLQDDLGPVRVSAANALAWIGPPAAAAIPALEQAANDEMFGDQARVAAASAIWWIDRHHPLVEPTFRSILTKGSAFQPWMAWMDGREAAANDLAYMGPQVAGWAVEPLVQLLEHESQQTRTAAFTALCWIGGESAQAVEAVAGIAARQKDNEIVSQYAFERDLAILFQNMSGPGAEALAAVIRGGEPEHLQCMLLIFRHASLDSDSIVMKALREFELQDR